MKKTITFLALAMTLVSCSQKTASDRAAAIDADEAEMEAQVAENEPDSSDIDNNAADNGAFDIYKYKDYILSDAYPRYAKSADPVRIVEYALIDIDNDGQDELWVRGDDGQDYQGVFAIVGDSAVLLADADVRSDIVLYKNAVGYRGYYGDGRVCNGASVLKNSRRVAYYWEEYKFNSFSDEQEMLEEEYEVNGQSVSAEECAKFCEQLGDEIQVPDLEWHAIKPFMREEE